MTLFFQSYLCFLIIACHSEVKTNHIFYVKFYFASKQQARSLVTLFSFYENYIITYYGIKESVLG